MNDGALRGSRLTKVYAGGFKALDDVSFVARPGRVLTLLGPSGCGKTTLLRIVAGLDHPTSGTLEMDGMRLEDVPVGRRQVGFVFQNYALYPHLTVAENLSLALRVRHVAADERVRRVREVAEMLGIAELLDRRPAQLSGGQQQRVALGRALAPRPRLYLLDEPLSNLDAALREDMRAELKQLFHRLEATVIYVTHDQAEAMSLSDDVAVLRAGRIVQCASPLDLYARPADLFVAGFVGSPRMTVWRGQVNERSLECRGVRVPLAGGGPEGRDLAVGIRPEHVEVSEAAVPGAWPGELMVAEPIGSRTLLTLKVGGEETRALAEPRDWPGRLWVLWPAERLHWFDPSTGRRVEAP